jgi:hypothetical protein
VKGPLEFRPLAVAGEHWSKADLTGRSDDYQPDQPLASWHSVCASVCGAASAKAPAAGLPSLSVLYATSCRPE